MLTKSCRLVDVIVWTDCPCSRQSPLAQAEPWSEKLGYPAGKKVLILHADDIGMCYEANMAAKAMLTTKSQIPGVMQIQSAALMVPCPWYNEMANWYKENPDYDIGPAPGADQRMEVVPLGAGGRPRESARPDR